MQCTLRCNIHKDCVESGIIDYSNGATKCILYGETSSEEQIIQKNYPLDVMKPMQPLGTFRGRHNRRYYL